MKARATTAFPGVRDGEVYPATIAEGEIIQGALAAAAVAGGLAAEIGEDGEAAVVEKAPEKRRKGKG